MDLHSGRAVRIFVRRGAGGNREVRVDGWHGEIRRLGGAHRNTPTLSSPVPLSAHSSAPPRSLSSTISAPSGTVKFDASVEPAPAGASALHARLFDPAARLLI